MLIPFVMSGGGGQWNHFYGKSSRFINFPLVRRFGSQNIIPSLISAGQNTKTDSDPLLRARPTSPKEKDKPHETDHIISSIALQSGGGSSAASEDAVTTKAAAAAADGESFSSIESDVDVGNEDEEEDGIQVRCLDLKASQTEEKDCSPNSSAEKRKKPNPNPLPNKKFKFNIL